MLLIRHAATDNNLANPPILQGRSVDGGLSEVGRRQAEQTARLLAESPIAAVYCSSMLRARETAACIARPHQLTVETCDDIVEVDVGRWESMSWAEIAQRDPESYRLFREDPDNHGYAGGETIKQVQQRTTAALERIMAVHRGSTIVVVGHSVVNRAYLAGVLNLPLARARGLSQDNAGMNVVRYRARKPKLLTLNATLHLLG